MQLTRSLPLGLCLLLALFGLSGCKKQEGFSPTESIGVISREEGSGTRSAFVELFGVEEAGAGGERFDDISPAAVITNNSSVMLSTVSDDRYAIGYLSIGALQPSVKALRIEGAEPSVSAIKEGTYALARSFNIAVPQEKSPQTADFIDFILSAEGQAIVEGEGYVPVLDGAAPYGGELQQGKIRIAGSSSVGPVMEKLQEAYERLQPIVEMELQINDSSTGIRQAGEGLCDIAMASRSVKESELKKGLVSIPIAMDGIAVIVNGENPIEELSIPAVRGIFKGEIVTWEEVME